MYYRPALASLDAFADFEGVLDLGLLAPVLRGEGVFRCPDTNQLPWSNLGPPRSHRSQRLQVDRSYLAAPVVSRSGEALGGLFFAHSISGWFSDRHEALLRGVAAQAAIAMDNARLFEQAQWAQNELQRLNEELRRINEDLEAFGYSASHDLQEPLRTITLSSKLLQRACEGQLRGKAGAFLDNILHSSRMMGQLLQDLLSYTTVTRAAEGPPPKVNPNAVLNQVLQNLKSAIDSARASVTSEPLPAVCIHESRLAQVLQNLLGNALKYRGSEPPCVHISAREKDGWMVFSVQDNGIGIEPQYTQQIFGLFKRLHSGAEYSGSGLGLAPARGSTFCLRPGARATLPQTFPSSLTVTLLTLPFPRDSGVVSSLAGAGLESNQARCYSMSPWENLLQNPQPRCHLVQLYDSGAAPAQNVGRYLSEGFKRGESALVIATPDHWNLFGRELDRLGIDIDFRVRAGQLQILDAEETLREIMPREELDWDTFERIMRQAARRLRRSDDGAGFRAYGEMVAILWKARRFTAAARLEQFWNKLLARLSFRLFCSYAVDVFGKNFHPDALDPLLRAHTHLLPARLDGKLQSAFGFALDEIFGADSHILRLLIRADRQPSWAVMPDAESMILWIRKNLPEGGQEVVERARFHYRRMVPDWESAPRVFSAAGKPLAVSGGVAARKTP